jgi:hypothetical protein
MGTCRALKMFVVSLCRCVAHHRDFIYILLFFDGAVDLLGWQGIDGAKSGIKKSDNDTEQKQTVQSKFERLALQVSCPVS